MGARRRETRENGRTLGGSRGLTQAPPPAATTMLMTPPMQPAPSPASSPPGRSSIRREVAIDAAVALLAVLFWLAVRLALNEPVVLRPWNLPPEGTTPAGAVFLPLDVLSYTAWAEQGRQGHLLSRLLFTLEPHDAVLFNPFFVAVGAVARLFDVSPIGVLEGAGLVFGGGLIFVARRLVRTITSLPYAVDAATLVILLGSGFSGWVKLFSWSSEPGMDGRKLDMFGVSALLAFPFQTSVVAILALALWILDRVARGRQSFAWCASLVACVAFVTASHVYEGIVFGAAIVAAVAMTVVRRERPSRDETIACVLVLGSVLPFAVVAFWTSRQPVWNYLAAVTTSWSATLREWIIGFGWLLPLATVGGLALAWPRLQELAGKAPRKPELLARVVIGWCAVQTLMVFKPGGFRTKFFSGAFLMFGILAGIGLAASWAASSGLASRSRRVGARLALALWCVLLLPTSLGVIGYTFGKHRPRLDNELFHASRLLSREVDRLHRQLVVLCDENDGAVIPGLAGVRVLAGYWVMTPDPGVQEEEIVHLGLTPGAGRLGGEELHREVDRLSADAVLVRRDASGFQWWTQESGYARVEEWNDRVLLSRRGVLSP